VERETDDAIKRGGPTLSREVLKDKEASMASGRKQTGEGKTGGKNEEGRSGISGRGSTGVTDAT